MRRTTLLMLLVALLATGLVAGCGGDDKSKEEEAKEKYEEAYSPINDDIIELGNEVGQAVNTARGKTDEALATQFASLGDRTRELNEKLEELEAPEEYSDLDDRLVKALDVVATDLTEIGEAAEASDPGEARKQAAELARHSVEVRTSRRELARKTGAKITSGSGS
jgi:hypothetical protein